MLQLNSEQIVALRPAVARPLPSAIPANVLEEVEAADVSGSVAEVLTILLRGSECTFRCTMCDLWKSTHLGPTPVGNLPEQIRYALASRRIDQSRVRQQWIKLYNASNFFAPYNVPTEDLPAIAELVQSFDRVVVENHPLLTSARIKQFASQLQGRLEVAMGLETVQPEALALLNKQVTIEETRRATLTLVEQGIDVRLFVLLRPPGLTESAAIESCLASIEAARDWGARHVSIIPVRSGNGAMEHLERSGHFQPPLAASLELVLQSSLAKSPMIVTADTWDWSQLRGLCPACSIRRRTAIEQANLTQRSQTLPLCEHCTHCNGS